MYKLLQEAQQKMNGYAVYMNYQFMHFGVKAEPAALLSVEVEVGGERMNLEKKRTRWMEKKTGTYCVQCPK